MLYRISGLHLLPGEPLALLSKKAAKELRVAEHVIQKWKVYRSSLDARKGRISFTYTVEVTLNDQSRPKPSVRCSRITEEYYYRIPKPTTPKEPPVIVGFGPAGMFAALVLARAGLCPVVIERGKPVESRAADIDAFFGGGPLDSESNVQFGEGGAGTFSDGKLNTLLKDKNYRGRFVLEELVKAGAPEQILHQSKPHVGTDKLRIAVRGICEEILRLGGKIYFESRFLRPVVKDGRVIGAEVAFPKGVETVSCSALFLAIGHSARDTFVNLRNMAIPMEKKIFSVGVRIEHLQKNINFAQYGDHAETLSLPAADYKLAVPTASGKTLYTFCMCPGGVVVPAASEAGGVVVNGMSNFDRGGRNANSALLLNVLPQELPEDLFSGFSFQRDLEEKAYRAGSENYRAPYQLFGDFLRGRKSRGFGSVIPSYAKGVNGADLNAILPKEFCSSLAEGIGKMGQILSGFDAEDAVLTGVESRATCPVRILRGENFQSDIARLFPIGEGAGFAGGIMSSAMDGMKAAEAFMKELEETV